MQGHLNVKFNVKHIHTFLFSNWSHKFRTTN